MYCKYYRCVGINEKLKEIKKKDLKDKLQHKIFPGIWL